MPPGSESIPAQDSVATVAIIVVAIIYIALFSWLAVIGWAKHRRLEREAYFRHETEKRLLESGEAGAMQILKLRHEEERIRWFRRREGLKLGGIITAALGVGTLVALQLIDMGDISLAGAGGFPLIIGAAILIYAYVLYPKFSELDVDIPSTSFGEQADESKI